MRAIDLHAHFLTHDALAEIRSAAPEAGATLVARGDGDYLQYPAREPLGPIPPGMFDVGLRLEEMDSRGIGMQVVAVPPPEFHYYTRPGQGRDIARIHNDAALALCEQHPERFASFATLPLQDIPAAVREMERVAASPHVRGVEIGTNVNGLNLDAAGMEPLWEAAEALDLPVWIHPDQRAIAGADRLAGYYLRNLLGNPLETTIAIAALIFGGVTSRHPQLRFGFVHGGGFVPYQIGRWDHGWGCRSEPKSRLGRPPSECFAQMFVDSLTHDRASLELLGRRVGWSQVVVGSDYPFDMADADPVASVAGLHLPERDRAAVLTGNAARFLRPVTGVGSGP